MGRTFVLGIGAQKAGTTWLSDYVRSDARYRAGPVEVKELHIWDRKDLPLFSRNKRRFFRWRGAGYFALACMERYSPLYFQYFSFILRHGGIAGDITPSYAGLSGQRLRYINDEFNRRGIAVKTVFVMRDPVSRCVSAFNMNKNRISSDGVKEGVRGDLDLETAFAEYIQSEQCRMRTNYQATLNSVKEGCADENVKILFYENLFETNVIRELSDFLGIGFRPDRSAIESNAAKMKFHLSEASIRKCAALYRNTYETIATEFPQAKSLWQGYRLLD